MIPKEGKDLSDCGNHHPIALLNFDSKLFTKILDNHLQPFLSLLIHVDQAGFIPHREVRHNALWTLNLIYYATTLNVPFLLLSTNAEKVLESRLELHLGNTLIYCIRPQWIHLFITYDLDQSKWSTVPLLC